MLTPLGGADVEAAVLAVARDITGQSERREASVESGTVAAAGALLTNLARDLNNRLGPVIGHAQMLQHRKIGRLPGTGYKTMVDCCRQIIEKFPGSAYSYKAKRMLADIPEHYRRRYKITDEEIDLSSY